jgi:hypothetical protein
MATNPKSVAVAELENIVQVMEEYIHCRWSGNPEKSNLVFYSVAIMYGYNTDGSLATGSWSQFKDFVKECGTLPEMKARIDISTPVLTIALCPQTLREGCCAFMLHMD